MAVALVLWWRMIRFRKCAFGHRRHGGGDASSPEPYAAISRCCCRRYACPDLVGPGRARPSGAGPRWWCRRLPGFRGHLVHLLVAYGAFTVVLMALLAEVAAQSESGGGRPAARLCRRRRDRDAIGSYLAALPAAGGPRPGQRHRRRYLPADGAALTFPMLQFSLLGAICLLGTLAGDARASSAPAGAHWHPARAGRLPVVPAVDAGRIGAHHTLLSFRLRPTLTCCWWQPGAFGFVEAVQAHGEAGSRCHSMARRHQVGRRDRVQQDLAPTCCGRA